MAKKYKEHYDCTKLLNSKDKDGDTPAIYIACSAERGPGKSYQFSRKCFQHWKETGRRFILLCRAGTELGSVAAGVLNSYIQSKNCPDAGYTIGEVVKIKNTYSEITATIGSGDDAVVSVIGYVIALRAYDKIKRISSYFYDADIMFFDEFQPMEGKSYISDKEPELLKIIYQSVARGDGSATRYIPCILSSNCISLGNPYFTTYDLNRNLQSNTRFYKGSGVVFERCEVEGLDELHNQSPIEKAYGSKDHKKSNLWILDEGSLVEKPDGWGHGSYVYTAEYNGVKFGVLVYPQMDYLYITRRIDTSCKYFYRVAKKEGELNLPLLQTSPVFKRLRVYYFAGKVRCQDAGLQRCLKDFIR